MEDRHLICPDVNALFQLKVSFQSSYLMEHLLVLPLFVSKLFTLLH